MFKKNNIKVLNNDVFFLTLKIIQLCLVERFFKNNFQFKIWFIFRSMLNLFNPVYNTVKGREFN
jgi:hypothetical protein